MSLCARQSFTRKNVNRQDMLYKKYINKLHISLNLLPRSLGIKKIGPGGFR